MKTINKALMALAAVLLSAAQVYAQYPGHEKYEVYPSHNVAVNKYLVSDQLDENDQYTLRLETFCTGSVTKHAIPTDFVIVLDNSGSMLEDCLYGKDRPDYVTATQMADPNDPYYQFLRPAHSPENLFLNRHCYSYAKGYSIGDPGQAMGSDDNNNVGTGWSYFNSDSHQGAYSSLYYYLSEDATYYKITREKSGRYCFLCFKRTNGVKTYIHSTSATDIVVSAERPPSDTNNDAENKILLVGFNGDNIYRPVTRMEELKPGFQAFIQSIYEHNRDDVWAPGVTKHQVAIVSFSQEFASGSVSNPSIAPPTGNLTYAQKHKTRVIKGFDEIGDDNLSSYKSVIDDYFSFRMGTMTFYGMRLATRLLQALQTQQDMGPINSVGQVNRNKVVILFTDGEPKEVYENGNMGTGSRFYTVRYTLQESELIKAKRTSSSGTEINGKVFCIDFAGLEGAARFLQYTSSNYYDTDATLPDGNYGNNPPIMDRISYTGTAITPAESQIFYMDANQSGGLEKAFADIADANTGDTSAQLVSVDVLSNNFDLPEGIETGGNVKLYTAQCIGVKTIDGEEYFAFAQPVPAHTRPALEEIWYNSKDDEGHTVWTREADIDIDNDVDYVINGKQIVFKGFDFANLWCGKDEDTDHHNTQQVDTGDPNAPYQDPLYRGFKLIAEFPIIVSPNAIGGPGVPTNVFSLSGLYGSDDAGNPDGPPIVNYPSPSLIISVKLVIRKEGLAKGESASFTIERKRYDDPNAVFTEFTSFILTGGDTTPEIRFVSLDPNYYYRVKETGWSWTFDQISPSTAPTTEDTTLSNPIVFVNKAKSNVTTKHAEAMVSNHMKNN